MTQIKILIYTDFSQINEDEAPHSWGITELRKLVQHKTRTLGNFVLDRRFRFESRSPHLRLTSELLDQYHELWVLCFIGARKPPFELDEEEVAALLDWMNKGGGLLVAGDHAAGFCDIGDPETFNTHGRALGEPMKRAGQLRDWVGPPTACIERKPLKDRDNYNTCEGDDPERLDNIKFQSDAQPARLLSMRGEPHSLFVVSDQKSAAVNLITRFPDHPHESRLIELTELDGDWPAGSPLPVTAAKARDRRFPTETREYPLVIAWDGPGQYGRIVADSSFHHYININLAGIPERDGSGLPVPNSPLDEIANFYRNLAVWLLPRDVRNQLKLDLLFRLAIDPDVFEVRGTGYASLGHAAQYALNMKWQLEELHWLLRHAESDHSKELDQLLTNVLIAEDLSSNLSVSQIVLLGAVIDSYHHDFALQDAETPDWVERRPDPIEMIRNGIDKVRPNDPSLGDKLLSLLESIK